MMRSQKGKITVKTGKRTDDLTQTELAGLIDDGHLEYIYQYEQEYWLNFVIDLIKLKKIKYHEWAEVMPWSKHKAAEILIERLIEKLDEVNEPEEPTAETISILDELRRKTAK